MGVNTLSVFFFAHFKLVNQRAPVRQLDFKTREVIVKKIKQGEISEKYCKAFLMLKILVPKISRIFIKLKTVKNCLRCGEPRALSARQERILWKILRL